MSVTLVRISLNSKLRNGVNDEVCLRLCWCAACVAVGLGVWTGVDGAHGVHSFWWGPVSGGHQHWVPL